MLRSYVSTFVSVSRANLVTIAPLSYPLECLQRDYLRVPGRLLARFLLSLLDCSPFPIPRACPSNLPTNAVREFAIKISVPPISTQKVYYLTQMLPALRGEHRRHDTFAAREHKQTDDSGAPDDEDPDTNYCRTESGNCAHDEKHWSYPPYLI